MLAIGQEDRVCRKKTGRQRKTKQEDKRKSSADGDGKSHAGNKSEIQSSE